MFYLSSLRYFKTTPEIIQLAVMLDAIFSLSLRKCWGPGSWTPRKC